MCLGVRAWQSGDHECLWITSLAVLRGLVEMCMPVDCWHGRPEGHDPVEIMQACAGLRGLIPVEIMCAYGSLAWQA
jgi:hypothetical protein